MKNIKSKPVVASTPKVKKPKEKAVTQKPIKQKPERKVIVDVAYQEP